MNAMTKTKLAPDVTREALNVSQVRSNKIIVEGFECDLSFTVRKNLEGELYFEFSAPVRISPESGNAFTVAKR